MTLKNYINGIFVPAQSRAVRTYHNPADNTALGEVAESAVESAVESEDESVGVGVSVHPRNKAANRTGGRQRTRTSSPPSLKPTLVTTKWLHSTTTSHSSRSQNSIWPYALVFHCTDGRMA